jgi:hypothetical protein
MNSTSGVWKDPDYYFNRFSQMLTGAGRDPAALTDDAMERVFAGVNSSGFDYMAHSAAPLANEQRLETAVVGDPWGDPPTPITSASPQRPSPSEATGLALETAGINPGPALADVALSAAELTVNPAGPGPRQTPLTGGAPRKAADIRQTAGRLNNAVMRPAGVPIVSSAQVGRVPSMAPLPVPAPFMAAPPMAAPPAAAAGADDAIAAQIARRSAAHRLGYIPADLGAGDFIGKQAQHAARHLSAARPGAGAIVGRSGKLLAMGARALPWVGAAMPAISGVMEGSQDGVAGAVIQGGGAAAGSAIGAGIGSFIAPGLGTVIGGALGGIVGNMVGAGGRSAAVSAVNRAQSGDTGIGGAIGRALDPLIDTQMERDSMATLQQLNSPAMAAVAQQQRVREAERRSQMAHDLLMQSYAQSLS